jgi:hypothetical protein
LAALREVLDGAAAGGRELAFVSGYSGIGKSRLVNELHRPVAAADAWFATGKFDLYRRDLPYAAFIQAAGELVRQVLQSLHSRYDRTTVEQAAIACAHTMGQGDRHKSDQVAVEAMRQEMDSVPIDGTIVIGEGERDEAPMLFIGEKVGIVGAGFMGSGIAESAARAGVSVVVHEPTERALERSRERIAESVSRAVERSKLSEAEAAELKERIDDFELVTISMDDPARKDRALETLPAEQRQTIELAYFGGFTQSELADRLGEPLDGAHVAFAEVIANPDSVLYSGYGPVTSTSPMATPSPSGHQPAPVRCRHHDQSALPSMTPWTDGVSSRS